MNAALLRTESFTAVDQPNSLCYSKSAVTGGPTMSLTGAMYFPHDSVEYLGNTVSNACSLVVADTIKISGTSKLSSSGCEALGLEPITAKYPSLVE